MDQLETLKKEWQAREHEFPKFTSQDIYPMLLKKSSSIVKWIVVISICELVFWSVLAFFIPESSKEFNDEMGLKTAFTVINVINYGVVIAFIYLFYRNYKKIQVTNSVKKLMGNILKTRKTVRYFVFYNIGMAALLMMGVNLFYYMNQEKLNTLLRNDNSFGALPAETFIGINVIAGVLLIGFLVFFYWLLYGLLLRRLKRNYKELKKIEV
ncbi:MAG: hypothetical protein KJO23_06315 [Bacteroidia bacterium]|nr:hypothetical protein [Bacteroidia bacterium]NNM23515.1 hypothetical protein [Flavobacteriaceae bacterium]